MNSAHDQILNQFSPEDGPDKRLTTWYAQGLSDALGDRLLMFDNTNLPSWEILRFKPALAHDSRFEAAVRERVEILSAFQHPSFPLVRPIKRLGHDDGLAVVSTYSSGAPLSDALKRPRSVDFALRMIRQLMPALVAFQNHTPRMSHGVLTVDRIVLSTEGRLMIREHMVGSALESLKLTVTRLWSEFGVLVPPTSAPAVSLDQRCDVAQLALIAVSLLAGRRLGPEDYPQKFASVLDEVARRQHSQTIARFESLRRWLERALQPGDQPFESAQDAEAALADFRDEPVRNHAPQEPAPTIVPPKAIPPPKDDSTPPMWSARPLPATIEASPSISSRTLAVRDRLVQLWSRVPRPLLRAATVGLCVVALVEAVIIGRLLMARSPTPAVVTKAVDTKPAETSAAVPSPSIAVAPIQQPAPTSPSAAPPPSAAASSETPLVIATAAVEAKVPETKPAAPLPAAVVRNGGFRVTAPIEVHVLDGERVLGSSADGPIMAPAGRREYDFVNSVIGLRMRRAVDVKPGQITAVALPVPNGVLNINAEPWAAVFIDGTAVGETPLGNLSVVPGEHEILFRHPQLGEKRQRTIVRSDTETRVSVNMQLKN